MILGQMLNNSRPEDVLGFWFPPQSHSTDPAIVGQQVQWWFRGGADDEIIGRFHPVLAAAEHGDLDDWSSSPRSRLALIIVLDQFSRSIHRGSARAYANDPKALSLTLEGLENGHVTALQPPWEMLFFGVPLGHRGNQPPGAVRKFDGPPSSDHPTRAALDYEVLGCNRA
jgi:uncharacterized protein (DUF924 family)